LARCVGLFTVTFESTFNCDKSKSKHFPKVQNLN
jgi:hypothetical protein